MLPFLQNHPIKSTFSKLRLLCRSLAGNNVYYLTITTPPPSNPPSATANINNNINNNNNTTANNDINNPQGSPSRCAACAVSSPAAPTSEEPKVRYALPRARDFQCSVRAR